MPYKNINELPSRVKNSLPKRAWRVYRDAFNYAYKRYPKDEARCHKIAWGAVKRAGWAPPKDGKGKWKKVRKAKGRKK